MQQQQQPPPSYSELCGVLRHLPSPWKDESNGENEEEDDKKSQGNDTQGITSHQDKASSVESQPEGEGEALSITTAPRKGMLAEECTICHRCYQEQERRPRTLPCGHTICTLCIGALLKEGSLSCPTCLSDHQASDATHFPVNYALENMIARFKDLQTNALPVATLGKTNQTGGTTLGRKLQSVLKEQREALDKLEENMKQELKHLEQYRVRLSLSLAKHGIVLKKLDRVGQHHNKAMKLLMEEDLRTEAFMDEGERNRRDLMAARSNLDRVTTSQNAYPFVDASDDSALVVEEWLRLSKNGFPNGIAYNTSCRVLDNTEGVLQVALESEDTTKCIPSGHPDCNLLEMLKIFHERSAKITKLHLKTKLRKALEEDPVNGKSKDKHKYISFPGVTNQNSDPTSPPVFKVPILHTHTGGKKKAAHRGRKKREGRKKSNKRPWREEEGL